jgi:UDP-N-acetylmuramate--alanine ligase
MNTPHTLLSKEGLLEYVKNAPLSLFITAGAGDIDKLVAPVKNILNSK